MNEQIEPTLQKRLIYDLDLPELEAQLSVWGERS